MPRAVPDVKNALKAVALTKKGLSIGEIGKVLGVNKKTVWRWKQYHREGKLCTDVR